MALQDKKQALSQGRTGQAPAPGKTFDKAKSQPGRQVSPSPTPIDKSAFAGRKGMIETKNFVGWFKKRENYGLTQMSPDQIDKWAGKHWEKKPFVDAGNIERTIYELQLKRGDAKTTRELNEIDRDIRALKKSLEK